MFALHKIIQLIALIAVTTSMAWFLRSGDFPPLISLLTSLIVLLKTLLETPQGRKGG